MDGYNTCHVVCVPTKLRSARMLVGLPTRRFIRIHPPYQWVSSRERKRNVSEKKKQTRKFDPNSPYFVRTLQHRGYNKRPCNSKHAGASSAGFCVKSLVCTYNNIRLLDLFALRQYTFNSVPVRACIIIICILAGQAVLFFKQFLRSKRDILSDTCPRTYTSTYIHHCCVYSHLFYIP